MSEPNPKLRELLSRVEREGAVALPPLALTPVESELIGNAISVNPYEPLMHYMKSKYFMQILTSESMRIKRLDTFEDDLLEGLYPKANHAHQSSLDSSFFQSLGASRNVEDVIASNRFQRQSAYVHCWFGGVFADKMMWKKYGDQGRGVCMKTTASRLGTSVRHTSDLLVSVCRITYLDEDIPIPTVISSVPFCRKRKKYSDEHEFRLLAEIMHEALPLDENGYYVTPPEFRLISVSLERLLEALVTGPNMPESEIAELKDVIAKKIPRYIVRPSELAPF